ncbi:MAG TPA: NlpC/P60 family protein, partial [Flavobacteriales bacterium]|nr:NlpC/P60 family protein [Flavobacteriales bacterium]
MNEATQEPEDAKNKDVAKDTPETPQVEQPAAEEAAPVVEEAAPVAEEAAPVVEEAA